MRSFLRMIALAACLAFGHAGAQGADPPDTAPATAQTAPQSHEQWIAAALKTIQAIKPGITRKTLEQTFVMDGGLSSARLQRYCYRACPYIKVDVTFETPAGDQPRFNDPDAKLQVISKPYLETPFMD